LVVERFDPGPPVGQAGWVGWSSSWMRAASWKSLSVSPPSAWLERARGDLVPADVDVGVVAGGLGCVGDLVDEAHRVGEVGAHEGLDDLIAAPLPTGQALQALLDRGVVQP